MRLVAGLAIRPHLQVTLNSSELKVLPYISYYIIIYYYIILYYIYKHVYSKLVESNTCVLYNLIVQ